MSLGAQVAAAKEKALASAVANDAAQLRKDIVTLDGLLDDATMYKLWSTAVYASALDVLDVLWELRRDVFSAERESEYWEIYSQEHVAFINWDRVVRPVETLQWFYDKEMPRTFTIEKDDTFESVVRKPDDIPSRALCVLREDVLRWALPLLHSKPGIRWNVELFVRAAAQSVHSEHALACAKFLYMLEVPFSHVWHALLIADPKHPNPEYPPEHPLRIWVEQVASLDCPMAVVSHK